jgi:hypothetical protein
MNSDTEPDLPPRTPENPLAQSNMDIDSDLPLQSSPDPLEVNGNKPLNPAHKRHNSSLNQLSQSRHQRNPTLFNFKVPVNVSESAKLMAIESAAESEKERIEQARNLVDTPAVHGNQPLPYAATAANGGGIERVDSERSCAFCGLGSEACFR